MKIELTEVEISNALYLYLHTKGYDIELIKNMYIGMRRYKSGEKEFYATVEVIE